MEKNKDTVETETAAFSEDSGIVSVVEFCLNLYKLQLEAPRTAPSEIVPVESQTEGPDFVYELHVERDEQWTSRRMAIAPIGEGSGSKSRCFKVIYDNLMVVKIPPSPITEFDEYIRSISAEGRIAVKLAPKIEFVAPGVTAILKKIHAFPDSAELPLSELEKRYVLWLEENPDFQEYLKIRDAFVFFMDLSKNSFLSYIVEKMHDKRLVKSRIREEIIESRNLLWDILGFEGKYGSESLSIYFDMNRVYADYEAKVRSLLRQYGSVAAVSPYEKQKWFLLYLADKEIKESRSASPEVIGNLNLMLKKLIKENKKCVSAYKHAVRDYIAKTIFVQNRPKVSGIITNMLSLLASLKESGVAIRDLKPDNLFVVGDSERSAEEYSLGLIDFETAVVFTPADAGQIILQPLLAGTPSYATPSHLFKNEILAEIFDDLPLILHFQDWQAVLGMIYNAATGACLFEKTRKLLPKISQALRQAVEKKQPLSHVFKKSSQIFWSNAVSEFKERINENEKILSDVDVLIPKNAGCLFRQNIVKEKNKIAKSIQKYVLSQVIFCNKENRRSLIRCSPEEIRRYKVKLEKEEAASSKTPPELKVKIMTLLKDLEALKIRLEKQNRRLKILEQPTPKISVYELLELMFHIILKIMYKEEWGCLSEDYIADSADTCEEKQREPTIVYENTILYD